MSEAPAPRPPWWLRARPWRWVARVLVLLFFLMLGGATYLLLYPPSLAPFQERIESLLSRRLERPVSYEGLDWVWRGDLRIRVHGLDIDGGAVTAERLLLGVDIWALLRGEARFTGLVLEGLDAELPFPAPANAGDAPTPDRTAALARLGALAARFDRLAVHGARLAFTGPNAPPGGAVEMADWDFLLERNGGGYWLETSARWGGGHWSVNGRIDDLQAGPSRWRLRLQARVADLELAGLAPLLPPAGPESLAGRATARVRVEGRPLGGDWSSEGEVDLRGAGARWSEQLIERRSGWDLQAGFHYRRDGVRHELRLPRLSLAGGAAGLDGSGRLVWGGDRPRGPRLEAQLTTAPAPFDAYRPLYRLAVVPDGLRGWLDDALVAGRLGAAEVLIDGPVGDLPFPRGRGTFRVRAPVSGLQMRYLPEWLPVTGGVGVLTVDRERLRFTTTGGRILTSPIQRLQVSVDDLTARNPVLRLDGALALDLADGARFLTHSPLLPPEALGPVQPVGPGRLQLGLRAVLGPPGAEVPEQRVRAWGQVDLQDAAVDLGGGRDPLVHLNGTVAFDGRKIHADPLTAEFNGREVTARVHTEPDGGPWRFSATSRQPARDLQHALLPGMPTRLLGELAVEVSGAVQPGGSGHYELGVGLADAALVLPDPLFKAMGEPGRFTVRGELGGEPHTEIQLTYPGARWAFSVTEREDRRQLGGAVGVGREPPELEPDRLIVAGEMPRLRLDRWLSLLREVGAVLPPAGPARPWAPMALDIGITTEALRWYDTNLGRVGLEVHDASGEDGSQGIARLSGERLRGGIRWQRRPSGRPVARVTMERVDLSGLGGGRGASETAPEAPAGSGAPAPVAPAPELALDLSVRVDRLIRDRLTLRDYHLNARLDPHHWWLDNLEATVADESRFYLEGAWQRGEGTRVSGSLRTGDFGRLLNQAGLYPSMRGGRGRISGGLAWRGPPWALAPGRLQGGFAMRIADGDLRQFTFLSKALTTLNILDLPQQVLGGFQELRSGGLHFRFLEGAALVDNGVVSTDDLVLESAPLRLAIRGGVDLGRRRYDLHIRAQPLQTVDQLVSAVPVFGYLITGKDKSFTDLRYHVIGPWSDPQVQAPLPQEEKGFWRTFYDRIRAMEWHDLVPWRAPGEAP